MDPNTPYPVIDLMEDQNLENLGHTMRLGKYHCSLIPGTFSHKAYGESEIDERHRHRYEFNNAYLERFVAGGMRIAGKNPERNLVEIVEIPDHPWFVAVQFHPELKSRPTSPPPLPRLRRRSPEAWRREKVMSREGGDFSEEKSPPSRSLLKRRGEG